VKKPRIVVFASGTADGGGSGFENLATSRDLQGQIVAVVSNHAEGGVRERAERLGIPFIHFAGPFDAEHHRSLVTQTGAEWVALSGWLKQVVGLDPSRTFNIHPALLSFDRGRFGGPGMYGMRIHQAVKRALDNGEISESGFSMHFVTDEIDRGPVFFEHRVPLERGMSAEEIAHRVNEAEHALQPSVTSLVVNGEIAWDGLDAASLTTPTL
jgi:folate-dependent phosphoribosylglycinamide formyltransferase PurN